MGSFTPYLQHTKKNLCKTPSESQTQAKPKLLGTLDERGGEGSFWWKNVLERCGVRAQTLVRMWFLAVGTIVDAVLRLRGAMGRVGMLACILAYPSLALDIQLCSQNGFELGFPPWVQLLIWNPKRGRRRCQLHSSLFCQQWTLIRKIPHVKSITSVNFRHLLGWKEPNGPSLLLLVGAFLCSVRWVALKWLLSSLDMKPMIKLVQRWLAYPNWGHSHFPRTFEGMWVLFGSFYIVSNFYWLYLHNKTRVALADLQWNVHKFRIQDRISPDLVMVIGSACLLNS